MSSLFDQRFPADLGRMSDLRLQLRSGLVAGGVRETFLERLILVVDEVVSNSIEHGIDYRRSLEPIRVRIRQSELGLMVEVDDLDVPRELIATLSQDFDDRNGQAPSAGHERGRGMFLVSMFLVDLQVTEVEGGGMRVRGRLSEDDV